MDFRFKYLIISLILILFILNYKLFQQLTDFKSNLNQFISSKIQQTPLIIYNRVISKYNT